MSIKLTNVTKLYGVQRAVSNVSFHIKRGEIVGFLGPNGAGKSTTMKMIAGYIAPTAGEIKINGINITQKPVVIKSLLGYLPEGNSLYTDMYVREYLYFIGYVFRIKNKKRRVDELLDLVKISHKEASKKIGQLSKGYKQRVGLASCLVHDPSVLILDEATSGLDPNQAISFRRLIREIAKQKAIFFSSHILADVEALCERIIVIHQGKIVTDDTLGTIKQKITSQSPTTIVYHSPNESAILLAKHLPDVKLEQITDNKLHIYAPLTNELSKKITIFFSKKGIQLVSISQKSADMEELFFLLTSTKKSF